MYYHFAILSMFCPFIKLDMVGSSISPYDICIQASNAIIGLITSYKQLYDLRCTLSFMPYFVLNASVTHMVVVHTSGSGFEQLRPCLTTLNDMAQCYSMAGRSLTIIESLARHWGIAASEEERVVFKDMDMIKNRRSNSLDLFSLNLDTKNMVENLQLDSVLLFCPFPSQGHPLLDATRLQDYGFISRAVSNLPAK
jgi:hypothetical protein